MKDKKCCISTRTMLLIMIMLAICYIQINFIFIHAGTKLKLSDTNITLHTGYAGPEGYQLEVNTNKNIKWSSSNEKVASVGQTGEVVAWDAGKAVITASVGNEKLKCYVTVIKITAYDKLAQTIKEKGKKNSDGNYFIKYTESGFKFAITYDAETKKFEFIGVDNNTKVSIAMIIKRNNPKKASIKYVCASNQIGSCYGSGTVKIKNVNENTKLYLKITEPNGNSKKYYQELGDAMFALCLSGWQSCLIKHTEFMMADLGFEKYY